MTAHEELLDRLRKAIPGVEIEVWWIPQIPMKEFVYPVPTFEVAKHLCNALARYDLFQFKNNIKPDYANMGGIRWRVIGDADDAWTDLDDDSSDEAFEAGLDEIVDTLKSRTARSLTHATEPERE